MTRDRNKTVEEWALLYVFFVVVSFLNGNIGVLSVGY